MALLVLAYPEFSKQDYERIQEFRRQHDELYYAVVKPHFTIVFPVDDWAVEPFTAEIQKQAASIKRFDFCLRCATINKDAFSDYYHIFLVPDEGHSHIVKLHDRLYADRLFSRRRLDLDFIPHVGVGNSKDALQCVEMAQEWNQQVFAIFGHIASLDVASLDSNTTRTLQRVVLTN